MLRLRLTTNSPLDVDDCPNPYAKVGHGQLIRKLGARQTLCAKSSCARVVGRSGPIMPTLQIRAFLDLAIGAKEYAGLYRFWQPYRNPKRDSLGRSVAF